MSSHTSTKRSASGAAVLVLVLLIAALGVGCKDAQLRTDNKTPVSSVEGLLQLRAANSTDTAAYMRHVESTALADALTEDAAARADTDTPIPDWNKPEVAKEDTSSAEVKVSWKKNKRFKEWVSATIFILKKVDGAWLIVDARDEAASKETTVAPK